MRIQLEELCCLNMQVNTCWCTTAAHYIHTMSNDTIPCVTRWPFTLQPSCHCKSTAQHWAMWLELHIVCIAFQVDESELRSKPDVSKVRVSVIKVAANHRLPSSILSRLGYGTSASMAAASVKLRISIELPPAGLCDNKYACCFACACRLLQPTFNPVIPTVQQAMAHGIKAQVLTGCSNVIRKRCAGSLYALAGDNVRCAVDEQQDTTLQCALEPGMMMLSGLKANYHVCWGALLGYQLNDSN